jgi:sulfonate transport system permease protein
MLVNTWLGVRQIPRGLRELSDVLTFSRLDYFWLVALPGALPSIFTGVHAALIYAWLATLGSEIFLNITPGIGGRLSEGSQMFEMDLLYLTILILGTIGLIYNQAAIRLEAILLKRRSR